MGVFELHLHEPNFTLNAGEKGSKPNLDWGQTDGEEERPPIAEKLGPVFVLLAVIVLAVLRNRRRE
ncbi:hypothetical protein ACFFQF_13395 [Haladaptatus pallidirubidus]|uniref:PGF-CTERM protein n=1 Tax=Haladaptatus pallidirubidus TaxID=1008152 RepID=A0AAV3UDH3_9EURY|nr:hypothetical protein [Haladaptatus pallidirubidus]